MKDKFKKFLKWLNAFSPAEALDLDEYLSNEDLEDDTNVYDLHIKFELPAEEAEDSINKMAQIITDKLNREFQLMECKFSEAKITALKIADGYESYLTTKEIEHIATVERIPQIVIDNKPA